LTVEPPSGWKPLLQVNGPLLFNPHFAVIDESPDWIVVDKPAHLLCHPTNPDNPPTMLDGLQGLLAFDLANGATLSIITRLDRDTSGLVLVAELPVRPALREKSWNGAGSAKPTWHWCADGQPRILGRSMHRSSGKERSSRPPFGLKQMVHPAGRACRTGFEVVERRQLPAGDGFALVRCFPFTCRMHQIRVHLAYSGHPVIGDKIYGRDETCYLDFIETGWTEDLARRSLLDRHALHAHSLEVDDERWTSPLPPDMSQFLADGILP